MKDKTWWEVGSFQWDWYDWSLNKVTSRWPNGRPRFVRHFFAFKCGLCRKFALGCKFHWFCGTCEPCRIADSEGE